MSRARHFVVALLAVIGLAQIPVFGDEAVQSAAPSARDLFQWYVEWDNVDYATNPPAIARTVPEGRVAVIDFVTFSAYRVECPLTSVTIVTTFRGLGSIHTVVGVVDVGPDNVGRHYGLSHPALVYASGGQQVTASIHANTTGVGRCFGDGGDFTVTGHLLPR
jgi:hypothetical protein